MTGAGVGAGFAGAGVATAFAGAGVAAGLTGAGAGAGFERICAYKARYVSAEWFQE